MTELKGLQKQAHTILAYNMYLIILDIYSEEPEHKLTKDEFMELNKVMWKKVKKELNIKIDKQRENLCKNCFEKEICSDSLTLCKHCLETLKEEQRENLK